jgi:hypothetical protein
MVELAIILPLMMVLFLGSWTAAGLIGVNDTALQATRAAARYAAELGGTAPTSITAPNCTLAVTNDLNTCQVDQNIINQVLPVVNGNMPNAVVTEIDIYEPGGSGNDCTFNPLTAGTPGGCPPDNGAYLPGDPIDVYHVSGTTVTVPGTYNSSCVVAPTGCYPLSLRAQTHPFEAELGVRITFTYTSPTLSMFTQTDTRYTVVRLAPME